MTAAAIKEFLPCPLNKTEAAAVHGLANGLQVKNIAFNRGISPHTVNDAVQQAKHKAGAKTSAHLVAIALRHGWVD